MAAVALPGYEKQVGRPPLGVEWLWRDSRRFILPFAATVMAGLAGGIGVAYSPLLLGLVVGLVFMALVLRSPLALTAMFGVAAFFSAWFFQAAQEGIFQSPSIATSIKTWGLLILVGLVVTQGPVRVNRRIAFAILLYAASIALSVPMAAAREGGIGPLFTGFDGVVLALSPLVIMILMARTGSRRVGVALIMSLIAIEAFYSLVQFSQLTWEDIPTTFVTVGNDIRWWDWKAVWGTFATTGKNAYGGAMGLSACFTLAWFTGRGLSPVQRLLSGGLFLLCAALAVMSESRSGALSVAAGAVVIGVSQRGARFLVPAVVGVLAIALIPATSSAFDVIQSRGLQDDDARARQHVWDALLGDRTPVTLVTGDGYQTITSTTERLNVQGLKYSTSVSDAPPPSENLYVRRLVEGGLWGLLALIGFFVLLLRETWTPSATAISQTWRIALRGVIVALIIQSFFADTLMFPQWAAIFFLFVGVAGGALALDEPPLMTNGQQSAI